MENSDPDSDSRPGASLAVDTVSGAGLGLLLGTVLGLATSPVVAVVVGALTSLLAIFLGLQGGEGTRLSSVQVNAVRIASFGLAAVLGVLFGLYVRINNPLAQSPQQQLARWTQAFPDNPVLAAQMTIYERSGLVPASLTFDPKAATTAVTQGAAATAKGAGLFSAAGRRDLCRELDPVRFGNDPAKVLDAYDAIEPLAAAASQVRALPDDAQRRSALLAARAVLCALNDKGGEK